MISERLPELMNEYRNLQKEWWKTIQTAIAAAGTDEFYSVMNKAETIDKKLCEIENSSRMRAKES